MNDNRALNRTAIRIYEALQQPAVGWLGAIEGSLTQLCVELHLLERLRKKLGACATRGWLAAGKRLAREADFPLQFLRSEVRRCEELLRRGQPDSPSLRLICEELAQTRDEFGNVRYDRNERCVAVETDPIELEDIGLGRFEIRVLLNRLAEAVPEAAIRAVALDPHPAGTNSHVTHPHVNDERICPGDAAASLSAALRSGRLCDAFLLVRSVLETYNPNSPYVSLDDWDGTPCWDCGYPASQDNTFWCECCEHDFCDECISYCHSCDTNLCRGCLSTCARCEEPFCEGCLDPCRECGESCCGQCIEDGICQPCLEKLEDNDEEEQGNESERPAQPPGATETPQPVRNQ